MPHRAVARMNRTVKESGVQLMKLWFIHENVYMPTNGETVKVRYSYFTLSLEF